MRNRNQRELSGKYCPNGLIMAQRSIGVPPQNSNSCNVKITAESNNATNWRCAVRNNDNQYWTVRTVVLTRKEPVQLPTTGKPNQTTTISTTVTPLLSKNPSNVYTVTPPEPVKITEVSAVRYLILSGFWLNFQISTKFFLDLQIRK